MYIEKERDLLIDLRVVFFGILVTGRPSVSALPIPKKGCGSLRRQGRVPTEVLESAGTNWPKFIIGERVIDWVGFRTTWQVESKCLRLKDRREAIFSGAWIGPVPVSNIALVNERATRAARDYSRKAK